MANWPAGNHPSGSPTVQRQSFRDCWQLGQSVSYPINNPGNIAGWELRNYYGTVIPGGAIVGSNIVLGALPLGWYKLYVIDTTDRGTYWKTYGGEKQFAVVRTDATSPLPDMPPSTTDLTAPFGDGAVDEPARGWAGIGPMRHRLWAIGGSADPNIWIGIKDEITFEKLYLPSDSARPQPTIIAVPNGYHPGSDPTEATSLAAKVTEICNRDGVTWFEGGNEPNITSAYDAYAPEMNAFADKVHTSHASARVMGPCTLSIGGDLNVTGTGLGWFNAILPLIKTKLDGISFHNYDCDTPNLASMRRNLDRFDAMLTTHGVQNLPRWNTEFASTLSHSYGSSSWHWQSKNTMLEMHILEQYKVPKEQTYLFYDLSHGFWGFPSWWMSREYIDPPYFGEPEPVVPLIRVWSEEVFGKTFSAKLDFGTDNDFYIGSRFTGGSSSVVILQSAGNIGTVQCTVSGATSVNVVDPWGNTSTLTVSGGTVLVPVDELPVYVRCPSGVTVTPVSVTGIDVVRASPSTLTASNQSGTAYLASNGDATDQTGDWIADASVLPVTLTITFGKTSRFNKVTVACPAARNNICALLDFDVQALISGSWTTVSTYTDVPIAKLWTSGQQSGSGYVDPYYRRRNHWIFRYSTPIAADGVRLNIRGTSYGGEGTNLSFQGNPNVAPDEIGQGGPQQARVREFRVWLNEYDLGKANSAGAPFWPAVVP